MARFVVFVVLVALVAALGACTSTPPPATPPASTPVVADGSDPCLDQLLEGADEPVDAAAAPATGEGTKQAE